MSTWLPVSAAPKDGTEIMLASDRKHMQWVDEWVVDTNKDHGGYWLMCDQWDVPVEPTHFKLLSPLPDAPLADWPNGVALECNKYNQNDPGQREKLSRALKSLESYREAHLVPAYFLGALKDLREVVNAPATSDWRRGFKAMRARAIEIAEGYCRDVPDHVDVEAGKNAFAAGYIVAAGGIKQALVHLVNDPAALKTTTKGEGACQVK